jgi:hypothetical protein
VEGVGSPSQIHSRLTTAIMVNEPILAIAIPTFIGSAVSFISTAPA